MCVGGCECTWGGECVSVRNLMYSHCVAIYPCRMEGLEVCGYKFCPLLHLGLTRAPTSSREDSEQRLQQIVQECMDNGVAVVTSKYLAEEINLPPPR